MERGQEGRPDGAVGPAGVTRVNAAARETRSTVEIPACRRGLAGHMKTAGTAGHAREPMTDHEPGQRRRDRLACQVGCPIGQIHTRRPTSRLVVSVSGRDAIN